MSKTGNSKVPKRLGGLLLTFFFFSGVCGLVSPMAIVYMMRHILGPPLFAFASILATFLVGVALGSYSAGQFIDEHPSSLKIYGILEGALGVYFLVLPFAIHWVTPLYTVLYRNGGHPFNASLLVRYLVFSPLLLIPSVLMGAILPVMTRLFHETSDHIGRDTGRVFGVYALGGCAGALAAGFFMLPRLGATATILVSASIDGIICMAAFALSKKTISGHTFEAQHGIDSKARRPSPPGHKGIQWLVLPGYGIALFSFMVYLVMLLRLLISTQGADLSAPFLIIPASLLGLALGSLIMSRFIDTGRDTILLLGAIGIATGLSILFMGPLLGGFASLVFPIMEKGNRFSWLLRSIIPFTPPLSVVIPTILLGVSFPLVYRICTQGIETIGKTAGVVFSIQALGAFFGIAGGMSILFFGIGIIKGTQFAAWSLLLIGSMVIIIGTSLSRVRKASLILFVIGIVVASIYCSIYLEMPFSRRDHWRLFPNSGNDFDSTRENRAPRLLTLKSGVFSTLQIEKGRGYISLLINGTTVCSLPRDLSSRFLAGHIPLLFHEDPKDVLLIGLECGSTLHAIEQHPVRILDCVEIHPRMCEGSDHFYDYHHGILEDPRLRMIHEDSRHYLAFTGRSYDIIICQPCCATPEVITDLFTEEFFHLCRKRLSSGGIAALRIPAQGMKEGIFRSILSAWHRVFPFATLWETALEREYLVTGSDRRMGWNDALINDRIQRPGIASDCAAIRINDPSADILSLFVMDRRGLLSYCRNAAPLSDGRALRESTLPHRAGDHSTEVLLEGLQHYRGRGIEDLVSLLHVPECSSLREKLERATAARHCLTRASIDLKRGEPRKTVMLSLREAMEKAPADREVVRFYAEILLIFAREYFIQRQYDMALWTLKEIMHAMPENTEASYLLGRTYYAIGFIEQARGEYEKVVACWQDDEEVRCHLGMAYLNSGWTDPAIDQFTLSIRFDPFYAEPHIYLGAAYFKKDLLDQAIEEYEKALAIRPDYADAYYNLGIACLKKGLIDEAIHAWKEVIRIRPDDVKARYNLAMAYYNHGELGQSMAQLEEILKIRPDFVQARSLLNVLNQARGR